MNIRKILDPDPMPLSRDESGSDQKPRAVWDALFNPTHHLHFLSRSRSDKVPVHLLQEHGVRKGFRRVKVWSSSYLGASILLLIASLIGPYAETDGSRVGVVIRCAVVAGIAALILGLALRAAQGNRRAYKYLVMIAFLESLGFIVVAMIVPGYPLWLKIAKLAVGLLAVGTALSTVQPALRGAFRSGPARTTHHR